MEAFPVRRRAQVQAVLDARQHCEDVNAGVGNISERSAAAAQLTAEIRELKNIDDLWHPLRAQNETGPGQRDEHPGPAVFRAGV
ncbi:hypothetical protein [Arthrobacter sp. H5]|uniref:hypothetical protein n=1 Tax=Arthrobacter sp. H5 TaxID=1267973 RepID=UPI0012DE2D83|nr:hypothetical protein [Arthrobacter sp. H5]